MPFPRLRVIELITLLVIAGILVAVTLPRIRPTLGVRSAAHPTPDPGKP